MLWNRLDPLVKFFSGRNVHLRFLPFYKDHYRKTGRFKNTKYYILQLFICISLVWSGLLTLAVFPFVIICLAIYCLQVILICIRNRLPDFSPKYPLLPINLGTTTFMKVNKNKNDDLPHFFMIIHINLGVKNIIMVLELYMQCNASLLIKHSAKVVEQKDVYGACLCSSLVSFTRPWEWWWSESDNEI